MPRHDIAHKLELKPPLRAAMRGLAWLAAIAAALAAILAAEALYALCGFGAPGAFTNPAHIPVIAGSGPRLTYVIIGDSTAAGRGAPYSEGIAMMTLGHVAKRYRVSMVNLSQSGATVDDVASGQLADASALRPDLALCEVGANDVTHFTPSSRITAAMRRIVRKLRAANPAVRIVLTGSPQMGAVPRFAQPLRWLAEVQTARVNSAILANIASPNVSFAPIVDTGALFAAHPDLFAADKFHPNAEGYAEWLPLIDQALDRSLGEMESRPNTHGSLH